MAFYRSGARVRMTRAITRAMNRSRGNTTNVETIERLVRTSKNRFGGAIARTAATAVAGAIDTEMAFQSAQFLFFDEGEDDDGTPEV